MNFLRKTKDIHALQRLLGHADLEATQIYAKYTDESTRRAFEIFDGNVIQADFGIPGSQSGVGEMKFKDFKRLREFGGERGSSLGHFSPCEIKLHFYLFFQ